MKRGIGVSKPVVNGYADIGSMLTGRARLSKVAPSSSSREVAKCLNDYN